MQKNELLILWVSDSRHNMFLQSIFKLLPCISKGFVCFSCLVLVPMLCDFFDCL